MNTTRAELQASLFDNYLKLNSLIPIRMDINAYKRREVETGSRSLDYYDLLESALDTLKLGLTDTCSQGRWRAGLMPLLNPLQLFNSLEFLRDRSPEDYQRMMSVLLQDRKSELPFVDIAKKHGAFADFALHTGRSLSAYVSAYKGSHSHFGRLSKFLRKKGWGSSSEDEMLMYLAHPLFRYDARQRYLEGKPLPLLEVDLIKQWATRHGVPLPQQVASYASLDEGERDEEGAIHDLRPDGSRLTRQQVIDQCKALLPDILAFIDDLHVDAAPEERDFPAVFSGFVALFAAASLHDDPAILTLPETTAPHLTLAYRRLSGFSRMMGFETPFDNVRRFALDYLNEGFYPSTAILLDRLLSRSDKPTPVSSTRIYGTTFSVAPGHFKCLRQINEHAVALTQPGRLFVGRRDRDALTNTPLTEGLTVAQHGDALALALAEWEEARHTGIYAQQRFHVLADSLVGLPETPILEETPCFAEQALFARALPTVAEFGDTQISTVGLLREVITRFVIAPTNQEAIERDVLPVLDGIIARISTAKKGFAFDNEPTLAPSEKTLMLPAALASTIPDGVSALRGDQLDDVAHAARQMGMHLRFAQIGALYLASALYDEAEKKEAAVTAAAANVQPSTSSRGNAFQELEEKMAALDSARDQYREWCEKAVTLLAPYIETLQEQLNLAVDFVPLTVERNEDEETLVTVAQEHPDMQGLLDEKRALEESLATAHAAHEAALESAERQQADFDAQAETLEQYAVENTQLKAQAQALTHHISEMERQKGAAKQSLTADAADLRDALSDELIAFSETPTPRSALALAAALYPDRLVILDSAYASAEQASDTVGANILRRLALLATQGLSAMREGNPLYTLNTILPGEVACSESDSSLQIPKLAQQRTFKETLPSGEVKAWVMTAHNWINYEHRLYFEYDASREVFVIGYAGRHLQVVSC